ncbi:proto-oncogene Mas-like [Sceloporus undulatus]|uniref:proto-oncogene Mas-like n=1 Tax=Sceloporus undulatus TaxID=8520 RepID=UPI001C4C5B6E|nr:proto-oncogene Mas-like [Sceloporus undulatus]
MTETHIWYTIGNIPKQPANEHFLKDLIIISSIPIAIVAFIGNGIVCCLFWSKWKSSRFFLYFLNIAIANIAILINVFVSFPKLYLQVRIYNLFQHLVQMVQYLGHNTRFYILTAICAERYLVIFFPALVKHYRSQYTSVIVTGILWGLSCLISVVDDLACSRRFYITNMEYTVHCVPFTILIIILELVIFLFIMGFSTVSIFIRMQTQPTPPARLDITILTTVLLFLVTDTPTRMIQTLSVWFALNNVSITIATTELLDCINCAVTPFIFLIVGCWKKTSEPIWLFLERALTAEESMAEGPQVEQEQV